MPVLSILLLIGMVYVFGHINILMTLGGIFLFVFLLIGWGKLTVQLLEKEGYPKWDVCLLIGFAIWGMVCFFVLWMGFWNPIFMGVIFFVGLLGWREKDISLPHLREIEWWGIGVVAFCTSLDVWGPLIDTDALYYHQALAKQMVIQQSTVGGWFEPNGSRPMLLHTVYASAWSFLGEKGPSLCHWVISMALLGSILERSKGGIWGVLLFISSWSVLQELGTISNNIPTAFAIFLTWRMVCQKQYRLAIVFAFVALSYKLTALGLIAGIWLLYIEGYKKRMVILGIVLALFSIWPIRNLLEGLPLLFPFSGWDEPFQHVEKYGMGRSLKDFVLLPWNVLVYAQPDSHIFQGRLSPMLLGSVLCYTHKKRRDFLLIGIGCLFWALGPQWLRHFVLVLPIAVFAVGEQLNLRWIRAVMLVGFLVGVGSNWGPMATRWSQSWEVIRGEIREEQFLEENVVGYKALQWVDTKIPQSSCPSLLFVWSGAVLNRPYLLSSVEDHIPIRSWLRTYQHNSFSVLLCDYVVVGPPAMSRKRYAFLSDEEYTDRIQKPLSLLEELLLQHGTLVYTAQGVRVYRLEKEVDKH